MDINSLEPSKNKNSKQLGDERSRENKLEEQVLKGLPSSASVEEKFDILLKKYIENEKISKKLNLTQKSHEKNFEILLREKEILQKEYNKAVLMKDKLEQVCREQQKIIKSVKNESFNKIKEEEEKRKENQAKFQDSINEISLTLNKNNVENIKLKEDNLEMAKKLKFLAEQYQARETQLQKIGEQIQLESQLHDAKLAKLQMESAIEKEVLLREKQIALDELLNCKKLIQEMRNREECLKEQLVVYTSKYDDFQNSLQKSNDIFVTYKEEIDKMYKNSRKLEKECLEWKKKWEKSNVSLIEIATEKKEKDEYIAKLTRQMQQLQKLLRALQAERNSLHQILKDHNIPRPPVPILPPEPEIIQTPTKSSVKIDQMAKNCAELKQTLSKIQDQMKTITDKQISDSVTPASPASKSSHKEDENKKQKMNRKSKNKGEKVSTKSKMNSHENSGNKQQNLEPSNLNTLKLPEDSITGNETQNSIPCKNVIENDFEELNSERKSLEEDSKSVNKSNIVESDFEEINLEQKSLVEEETKTVEISDNNNSIPAAAAEILPESEIA